MRGPDGIGRLRFPDVVIEHVCTHPDDNDFIDIRLDLPRAPHIIIKPWEAFASLVSRFVQVKPQGVHPLKLPYPLRWLQLPTPRCSKVPSCRVAFLIARGFGLSRALQHAHIMPLRSRAFARQKLCLDLYVFLHLRTLMLYLPVVDTRTRVHRSLLRKGH